MHFHIHLAVLFAACNMAVADIPVFAHFMVQNSYSYSQDTWSSDMSLAQSVGIDGFVLNWVPPDCQTPDLQWQAARIDDAFAAAGPLNFKLFYSFDMSYIAGNDVLCPTGNDWNVSYMAQMVQKYVGNYALFSINYAPVVSTYDGDKYTEGFFEQLKSTLSSSGVDILLAPAFTSYSYATGDASQYSPAYDRAGQLIDDFPAIDGFTNWQAWPYNSMNNLTKDADAAYKAAFNDAGKAGPYIMAVSPWQYKDLNDGNTADSWVEYSDYLYPQRWEAAIAVQPDIIEILTWNDWPESHYISELPPSDPSQPRYAVLDSSPGNFGNYIYNHPHDAWRVMTKYYTLWIANNAAPTPSSDNIVFWYRRYPKSLTCSGGGQVRNSDYPRDAVFFWAIATSDATVSVTVGDGNTHVFAVNSSRPAVGMVPFPSDLGDQGVTPFVELSRNGASVVSASGNLAITSTCSWTDFNPTVGLAGTGNLS